jgi:hypothetical protein
MKTQTFLYYFADEPQFATTCGRAWLANYLRACRKPTNKNRMAVERIGRSIYHVTLRGCSSKAIIGAAQ